jgi:sugar-specific transcriptional regulator TrmB/DNA-binding CsgD family transcriptional regulator
LRRVSVTGVNTPSADALRAVGLTEPEIRCYAALVEVGMATARQLAEESGLAQSDIGPLLRSLESKGLVSRTASRPRRFVPAPPEIAVENLASARERELAEARLAASQLQQRLQSTPQHGTAGDLVEVVLGRESVIQRYRALNTGAKEQVEILLKPPYVSVMAENPSELAALRRGVRYRLLYEVPMLELAEQIEVIRTLGGAGAAVRVLPSLPTKLAIFDRRYGYLAYAPQPEDRGVAALLIRPSPLLDALSMLFEDLWSRSVPFAAASRDDARPDLSESDRRLLTLLAAGLQDEAIAYQLGVAHRTVQRRVARLMAVLGAKTRFQAGLQARDRGWIAPEQDQ